MVASVLPPARSDALDAARGLGIVLVVLGHVDRGMRAGGLFDGSAWYGWGLALDLSLYIVHMPLLMLLAGINVPASLARGAARFRRSRLLTVGLPYVVWSLITLGALRLAGPLANHAAPMAVLPALVWTTVPPFWFLHALLAYLMIASVVPPTAMVALALAGLAVATRLAPLTTAHQWAHFLSFFVVGMLAGSGTTTPLATLTACPPRAKMAMGTLAALVMVGGIAAAVAGGARDPDALVLFPVALAGSLLVLLLAPLLARAAMLVALGRASLGIYAMHVLFLAATRVVVHRLVPGNAPAALGLHLAAGVVIGIIGPWTIYRWLDRRGWLPWLALGIGPRQRRWIDG